MELKAKRVYNRSRANIPPSKDKLITKAQALIELDDMSRSCFQVKQRQGMIAPYCNMNRKHYYRYSDIIRLKNQLTISFQGL